MPDLAPITISKVLWANAGSSCGCQGEGFPKSLSFLPLQNWALISSLDFIKLVNVPSATVRVVGGRVDFAQPRGWGRGTSEGRFPLSQAGVTLVLNYKPALCRVGDWRERGGSWGGAPQAFRKEGSPGLTRRVPRPTPRTPLLDKRHSAVKGHLPDNEVARI